jgi:hypothetical protein
MNYQHTAHRATRMSEGHASAINILRRVPLERFTNEPYLLQPHAGARIDTNLANPGRMAATEAMAPAPMPTVLQQPCKGIVCNFDAACADHHCPGHPFNTSSEEPTDFAGLDSGDQQRNSFMHWPKAAAVFVIVWFASLFMGDPTEH